MAKDIDLFRAYFMTAARRRTRTSLLQALVLAVPLANAPTPSQGSPPRTQDHKKKSGDWDSYPLVYIAEVPAKK
jgi:hypothetical protein